MSYRLRAEHHCLPDAEAVDECKTIESTSLHPVLGDYRYWPILVRVNFRITDKITSHQAEGTNVWTTVAIPMIDARPVVCPLELLMIDFDVIDRRLEHHTKNVCTVITEVVYHDYQLDVVLDNRVEGLEDPIIEIFKPNNCHLNSIIVAVGANRGPTFCWVVGHQLQEIDLEYLIILEVVLHIIRHFRPVVLADRHNDDRTTEAIIGGRWPMVLRWGVPAIIDDRS